MRSSMKGSTPRHSPPVKAMRRRPVSTSLVLKRRVLIIPIHKPTINKKMGATTGIVITKVVLMNSGISNHIDTMGLYCGSIAENLYIAERYRTDIIDMVRYADV